MSSDVGNEGQEEVWSKSHRYFLQVIVPLAVLYDVRKGAWFIANSAGPQKSGPIQAAIRLPMSSLLLPTASALGWCKHFGFNSIYPRFYEEVHGLGLNILQFKNLVFTVSICLSY